MAVLVRPDPQKFPVGSSIAAYQSPAGWQPERPTGPPPGTLVETQTVASGGIATFSALTYNAEYVGYGSSPDRYWRFEASLLALTSGGGGALLADEGTTLTQRGTINFVGAGVTAVDNATTSSSDVTVPGLTPIESVNVVATSGAAQTLPDVTVATEHLITLTAACTITFPTVAAGKSFLVALKQDATGSRLVTWPASVAWSGQVTPVLTTTVNAVDVFSFVCLDGTTWIGLQRANAISSRPYRSAVMADTPLSYYRLGEQSGTTAADEMALNTGTYSGGFTIPSSGLLTSELDGSVLLNGTTGKVVCKTGALLGGRTNFTIEAVIKPNSLSNAPVVYAEIGSAGSDLIQFNSEANGILTLTYRDHANVLNQRQSTTTLGSAGVTHHVAVTKAGTAVKIYIDGNDAGLNPNTALTASDTFGEATTVSTIGSQWNGTTGTQWFNGKVDEVAVYATALSAARIAAHAAQV